MRKGSGNVLEYSREFLVLASCMNFTAAAKRLNMTQPGLSRHIAQLEKELGFTLVTRSTPLSLTPAGKRYLELISPLIEEFDDAVAQCRDVAKAKGKPIRIHTTPLDGYVTRFIMSGVAAVKREYPGMDIRLVRTEHTSPLKAVLDGLVDVSPIYYVPQNLPQDFVCELLYEEPFHIWLHRDNPLAYKEPFYFADLAETTLMNAIDPQYEDWNIGVRKVCERYGFKPKYILKDIDGLTDFIFSLQPDELIMTSSAFAAQSAMNQILIDRVPNDAEPHVYPSYLVYRKPRSQSVLETFLQGCRVAVIQEFGHK